MMNLSVKLTEIRETHIYLLIRLEFLGYTLINSQVGLPLDIDHAEWSNNIDLIRWYYKTSRR